MGGASSTIVATTGTCSNIMSNPPVTAASCAGTWDPSISKCTIQQPSFTSTSCTDRIGMWIPSGGMSLPVPMPPVQGYKPTTPVPRAVCACTGGAACPSSKICTGCLKNGVCTSDFATAAECDTFATAAKWCGA